MHRRIVDIGRDGSISVWLGKKSRIFTRRLLLVSDDVLEVGDYVLLHSSSRVMDKHSRQVRVIARPFPVSSDCQREFNIR